MPVKVVLFDSLLYHINPIKAMSYKGHLVLIVGPSGSGKGSVIRGLKDRHPDWLYPVSYTTREMRPGEKDGEVYNFISKEKFLDGVKDREFLEYAIVHEDHYYGTAKKEIIDALEKGNVVVREVDIQGFKLIRDQLPAENLTSLFLMVNSLEDLIGRILKRSKLPDDEVERRMQSARHEMAERDNCDFVVPSVTGEVEACTDQVEKIILSRI
jgi:guanylate kinase